MERCSQIEMRKNLLVVQKYSDLGLDFVVIPAKSPEHKLKLTREANSALEEIVSKVELKENKS